MKIEIYIGKEKEEEKEDDLPPMPTAFHRKVARMLAKKQGRSKPNEMDMKRAMEVEEED